MWLVFERDAALISWAVFFTRLPSFWNACWKIELYNPAHKYTFVNHVNQDQKPKRWSFARMSVAVGIDCDQFGLKLLKNADASDIAFIRARGLSPFFVFFIYFSPIPQHLRVVFLAICGSMISARCIGQAGHCSWRVIICMKDTKRRTNQLIMQLRNAND